MLKNATVREIKKQKQQNIDACNDIRTIHYPPSFSLPRDMKLRGGRILVYNDKSV
jgi:hypothetical protein